MNIVNLGSPVVSSRQWTTALSPRNGGGWNFITQSYNYPQAIPTEWVVVNLDSGGYAVQQLRDSVYANSNFQAASLNTAFTHTNQLRAPNGRIFFLEVGDGGAFANMAYYDPADELVHQFAPIDCGGGSSVALSFSATFDHAGDWLYVGTQAPGGDKPYLFRVNTTSLVVEQLGEIGTATLSAPRYAYYIAKDAGPGSDYVYVAVGQLGWELISIKLSTGIATTLYTTSGPGFQFIQIGGDSMGCGAVIYDNGVPTEYWLAQGALSDGTTPAPPLGARDVTPYAGTLSSPPEIDWSGGIGKVLWRPAGSFAPPTTIDYTVTYRSPITLESLNGLADGGVLGSAAQYNGYFSDRTGTPVWYGAWVGGLSSATSCAVSPTLAYLVGYPNGSLYRYNPTQVWEPGIADPNPLLLGDYHTATGMKYPYSLQLSSNGRLYSCGRRERDSTGTGIGYYSVEGETFSGENGAPLDNYAPRSALVMDSLGKFVVSGRTIDGSDAKLLVYDLNLGGLVQRTVEAGHTSTGALYPTADPDVILGICSDAPCYAYLYNVATHTLLDIGSIAGSIGAQAQNPTDKNVWAVVAGVLSIIDPVTLGITQVATIGGITGLAWNFDGTVLYFLAGTELWKSTDAHTTPEVPPTRPPSGMARPLIPQPPGRFPRAPFTDDQVQEDIVTNLNEHASAIDSLTAATLAAPNTYSGLHFEWNDDWLLGAQLAQGNGWNGSAIGSVPYSLQLSGANTAISAITGHQRIGVVSFDTGTTNAGQTGIVSQASLVLARGTVTFEATVGFAALSTSGEEYHAYVGLTGSSGTYQALFLYDRGNTVSGGPNSGNLDKWSVWTGETPDVTAVLLDGTTQGGIDTVDSPVATYTFPDTNFYRLKVVATPANAKFYINSVLVATIATTIPTHSLSGFVQITKTAGTSVRSIALDQTRLAMDIPVQRVPQ